MPHGTCPPQPELALIWTYEALRKRTLDPWAQELADSMEKAVQAARELRKNTTP
jgi:hypothetical protein